MVGNSKTYVRTLLHKLGMIPLSLLALSVLSKGSSASKQEQKEPIKKYKASTFASFYLNFESHPVQIVKRNKKI